MRPILMAALLLLAACDLNQPEPLPPGMTAGTITDAGAAVAGPDTCGAAALAGLTGKPSGAVADAALSQPVRMIPAGGTVSGEVDPARVNLYLDAAGLITRVSCG